MRLRAGELIAAAAAVALFVLLFLDWTTDSASGWESLWIGTQLLIDVALLFALAIPLVIATRQTVAAQMVVTVVAAWFSLGGLIALTIDAFHIARDDDKLGAVGLHWPAYTAVAFALVLFAGVWRSMSDERLDATGSEYTPPEPRAAPPA